MRHIAKVALLGVVLSAVVASAQSQPPIQGAWRLVEITTTGANGSTNRAPQPSLYLFTAKQYSITRVMSDTPRPQLKDPAKVTEAEALAIFGPFQAQAGTYEVAGGSLSMLSTVAKQPQGMTPKRGAGADASGPAARAPLKTRAQALRREMQWSPRGRRTS